MSTDEPRLVIAAGPSSRLCELVFSRESNGLSEQALSTLEGGAILHLQSGLWQGVAGMFLTLVLLRNKIPGKQWIGKHRRPRFVSSLMKKNMIRRLEIEAENEYWLSRSYMTEDQEYRHNEERRHAQWGALVAASRANFPEHKYATEHLNHLNVTKKWVTS